MFKKKKASFIAWAICFIGALFFCYEYLLRIQPSVMVTELMKQFSIAATGFGFIIALYYYAYTPMQLFVGILIDRYGTRLMIGLGIICCSIGSLLFSIAHGVYLAGFARLLMGFGSSFAFVGVLKLGAEWLPKQHFAFLAGLVTSLGMFAGMFGDVFLIHLVHTFGHKSVLILGTIAGILLIPIIFIFVHDTPEARQLPTRRSTNFKNLFAGLKEIFKMSQMWYIGIVANVLYLSLTAFAELWGIKFVQAVYGFKPDQAALASSMVFLGWFVGSPFAGWLSDHIRSRRKPIIVSTFLSAILITLVILDPFHFTHGMLCLFLFLFGAVSSFEVICFAISRESNPHHLAATALAFTNFIVMLGGLLFQPLIGFLLDLFWKGSMAEGIRTYSTFTYKTVFMLIPISIFIGSFLSFKIKETMKK